MCDVILCHCMHVVHLQVNTSCVCIDACPSLFVYFQLELKWSRSETWLCEMLAPFIGPIWAHTHKKKRAYRPWTKGHNNWRWGWDHGHYTRAHGPIQCSKWRLVAVHGKTQTVFSRERYCRRQEEGYRPVILLTMVGTWAYKFLHSLLEPTLPSEKSYGELVKALQEHLTLESLVIAEQFRLNHCNQQEGETVAQYLAALWKHLEWCDFGDYLEQALRYRRVCRLQKLCKGDYCRKMTWCCRKRMTLHTVWRQQAVGRVSCKHWWNQPHKCQRKSTSSSRKTHQCRRVPATMLL